MDEGSEDSLAEALAKLASASSGIAADAANGLVAIVCAMIAALKSDGVWSAKTNSAFVAALDRILADGETAETARVLIERMKYEVADLKFPSGEDAT